MSKNDLPQQWPPIEGDNTSIAGFAIVFTIALIAVTTAIIIAF